MEHILQETMLGLLNEQNEGGGKMALIIVIYKQIKLFKLIVVLIIEYSE